MLRRQALYRVEVSWRALAAAPRGSRNSELNRAAFRCGRVIGAGWLHRAEAGKALVGASISNGLMRDDGLPSVRATITSGLDAGLRASPHQPRRFRAPSLARPLTEHEAEDQNQKIQGLWRRGGRVEGTIAEIYLRQARVYGGAIPRTFRFLPPSGSYPPALMVPKDGFVLVSDVRLSEFMAALERHKGRLQQLNGVPVRLGRFEKDTSGSGFALKDRITGGTIHLREGGSLRELVTAVRRTYRLLKRHRPQRSGGESPVDRRSMNMLRPGGRCADPA